MPDSSSATGFLADVVAQPDAATDTLNAIAADDSLHAALRRMRPDGGRLILTGMGSSLSALYPTHLRLLAAGLPSILVETGELLHYAAEGVGAGRTLVLMVSQSGESIEVVRLLERIRGQATIIGVTNEPDSPLARQSDATVLMRAGREGIVATRTYVSTLAALAVVTGVFTNALESEVARTRAGIAALRGVVDRREAARETLVQTFGDDPGALFLVGRGASYASASAGALILKEASHTAAEALTGGAFRHGPLEMVDRRTSAIVFSPAGRTAEIARRLAADIVGYGGRVVVVGPRDAALPGADLPLVDTGHVDELAAPMAEVVIPELLADALSQARGHAAGHFERMGKVTREE